MCIVCFLCSSYWSVKITITITIGLDGIILRIIGSKKNQELFKNNPIKINEDTFGVIRHCKRLQPNSVPG